MLGIIPGAFDRIGEDRPVMDVAADNARIGIAKDIDGDTGRNVEHQRQVIMAGGPLHPHLQILGNLEDHVRSEEHTSELQSLMRISYAVFCLKKKKIIYRTKHITQHTIYDKITNYT